MTRPLRLLVTIVLVAVLAWAAQADGGRAKGPGRLSIETTPWSHVRVDGKRIGKTPIRNHSLPAGAHRIELNNPVLGLKRYLEVIVHPGKVTHLKLDLNR